jgi:hypothetical protein
MRFRFYGTVILLAGSLVFCLLLLLFSERISSVIPIPSQVVAFIGGTLLVGFYEGVGIIREILKERDERRLKHSHDLKECLQEWSATTVRKDSALREPDSRWFEETREHLMEIDDRVLFIGPGFQTFSLTPWELWYHAEGYSQRQHDLSNEIGENLTTRIGEEIEGISKDFRDAVGISLSGVTRYYYKTALVNYVYQAMDGLLKMNLVLTVSGKSQNALSDPNTQSYVDSPRLDELEKIRDFLFSLTEDVELLKLFESKQEAYGQAFAYLDRFRHVLVEIMKDIESFRPMPGKCHRCP